MNRRQNIHAPYDPHRAPLLSCKKNKLTAMSKTKHPTQTRSEDGREPPTLKPAKYGSALAQFVYTLPPPHPRSHQQGGAPRRIGPLRITLTPIKSQDRRRHHSSNSSFTD